MEKPIRILVAETQTLFRAGLCDVLTGQPGVEVVAQAADSQEAWTRASRLRPDIVLLGWAANALFGLDILRRLAAFPEIRTVVLTTAAERGWILEAFRLGARGAVLRSSGVEVILQCIRDVMRGACWAVDREVPDTAAAMQVLNAPPRAATPKKTFGLTRREIEVIAAVVSGFSNREIATTLGIGEDTVKHHLTNIFDKVGVYNRLELALFAVHQGIAPLGQ
jgi:DNA-binding NarL/FixJ family response regulator